MANVVTTVVYVVIVVIVPFRPFFLLLVDNLYIQLLYLSYHPHLLDRVCMLNEMIIHPIKGKMAIAELDECEALLILSSMPAIGTMKIKALLHYLGSAVQALQASSETIAALPGFGEKIRIIWEKWPCEENWKKNFLWVHKCGARLIGYHSPDYPKRLLELPDRPVLLYVKGEIKSVDSRSIAIVGTRQASIYGQEMARQFGYELAALGFTVVSGLARGVDTAAHLGALESNRTIAVIGSGLANIYPAENRGLAEEIATKGAVISEFPMMTPPDKQNFPQRNRIVSGMTLATLLIEAPIKSGAMITMERALEHKRRLFAIPGRVDCPSFRGNHILIKQGRAQLVENAQEIADSFDDLFGALPLVKRVALNIPLDKEEKKLLDSFPDQEISIEQIVAKGTFSISTLNVLLMSLVLKGVLKEFPGKVYKKIGVAG